MKISKPFGATDSVPVQRETLTYTPKTLPLAFHELSVALPLQTKLQESKLIHLYDGSKKL